MRVAIFNKVDRDIIRKNIPDFEEVGFDEDPEALIVRSKEMHDIDMPDSLIAVCRSGSGVDNIPIEQCSTKGIAVFNAPGGNASSVKEIVVGSIIGVSRNIVPADRFLSENPDIASNKEKRENIKSKFRGQEIRNKKILVVGLGAVGSRVAKALRNLEMEVYGYDPYISEEDANEVVTEKIDSLDNLDRFDYVTLHAELTKETREIVDKEFINKLKDGVILINFARGGMVVSEDVVEAVRSGKIAAYATDFPDDKIVEAKNDGHHIVITPHLGAMTPAAKRKPLEMVVNQLMDFREKGHVINSVNFPEIRLEPVGKCRIVASNINAPGMLAKIEDLIGKAGFNIKRTLHRTKNDVGYGITDIDNPKDNMDDLRKKIESLEGVTKVRIIHK